MIVKSVTVALLAAVLAAKPKAKGSSGAGAVATRQKSKPEKAKSNASNSEFTAEDDLRFSDYAAKNGKSYKSRDEFTKREKNWKHADDYIKQKNEKNKDKVNGMKLAHNSLSDLTDEEFKALLGLSDDVEQKAHSKKLTKGAKKDEKRGRKLAEMSVDHAALGHMTPVKSQGVCGSCWAFTANSVLEGTISAMNNTAPVALSE